MAKNLKLNIKNAQLAEALKLQLPKKAASPKKAKETEDEKPAVIAPAPKQEAQPVESTASMPEATPVVANNPPLESVPVKQEEKKEEIPVKAETPQSPPSPKEEQKPAAVEPPKKRIIELPKRHREERPPYGREPFRSSSYNNRPSQERSSDSRPAYPRKPAPQTGSSSGENFSYPVGPNYPVRRPAGGSSLGGAPSQRPPFRRDVPRGEPRTDFRKPPISPMIKEPFVKEIPQQHQVYHKKSSQQASTTDASKKAAQAKDAKSSKKSDFDREFDARDRQGLRTSDDETWRKKKAFKAKQQIIEEINRPKQLKIRLPIMLKDLAGEMKLKSSQLIAKLFMQGVIVTLNDYLDDETTVQLLGHEFECEISIDTTEEERIRVTDKTIRQEVQETEESLLCLRPPVVTFMGHVDHGKTSLIDAIRKSNIASTEAGAITQHIGAFKCHTQVGEITILDTPGHEAFSAMRERGADVTDIVVLVVAGDEGIKTQTIEAISQAQKANVPLVVALNKCDKPAFNAETVYRQLADNNLLPEAWGGSIITVNCSATTGAGIKDLLEMLALQAEILELKANPNTRARGSVIESEMHKGLGTVATLLIQNGTLHLGDALVFDQFYARVKTMHDEHDRELLQAGPSSPVKITGLSGFPEAGSEFIVVKDEKEARDISEKRNEGQKLHLLQQGRKSSLENLLQNKADSAGRKTLNLILKADVQGSLEALKTSLRKIPSTKVELNFVSEGVGEISESDIQLAAASKATILGFHTKVESHAETLIKQTKVTICLHDIIYHAVDDIKKIMLSCLDKLAKENETGEALVKAVFKSSQIGNIAGCQVTEGTIRRNNHARVIRNKETVWKGPIASLKRVKEDVKDVQKGYECGILLQGFSDFKEGDIIQAYEVIYLQQEL